MSKFGDDFFRFLSHFPFTCGTVTRSVFMINQRNLHFWPGFQGQSFTWEDYQWCWISPYAISRGTPTPSPLLHPPRFTNGCIRHNASSKTHYTSSLLLSITGSLVILSQLPCWQCLHALVHSSPCFLQVHLRVLNPSKQLQWIIWISAFGAELLSVITGISLFSSAFHLQSDGCISSLHPIHSITW